MENKLNIAEILKNCPQGMELKCTMWDKVILDHVDMNSNYPIRIKKMGGEIESLTENGCFNFDLGAKCVIFPTDKTTWEGFIPPFKDGDIVTYKYEIGLVSMILNKFVNFVEIHYHCALYGNAQGFITNNYIVGKPEYVSLATEEEKVKLFKAIQDNGYKWNAETKTLERLINPKFKVGDVIQDKEGYKVEIIEVDIDDECYGYISKIANGIGGISFKEQDDWKLVPDKFDISTLAPFESKVLVRNTRDDIWRPAIFGCYIDKTSPYYVLGGFGWRCCIPYEGNEHLLGKNKDCDEFYKTW